MKAIKNYFYEQSKGMGYSKEECAEYFEDCKCRVFVGVSKELKAQGIDNYFVIAEGDDDLMIVETFNGTLYDFI